MPFRVRLAEVLLPQGFVSLAVGLCDSAMGVPLAGGRSMRPACWPSAQ